MKPLLPARTWLGRLAQALGAGLAYWAVLVAGERFARHVNSIGVPLLAPTGVALAGFLLMGSWSWPAVFAAAYLWTARGGLEPELTTVIATASTAAALVPALVLRRIGWAKAPRLDSIADVARFAVAASVLGPLAGLGFGALALFAFDLPARTVVGGLLPQLVLGSAGGTFLLAPLLLAWLGPPSLRALPPRGTRMEALGLAACFLATAFLAAVVSPFSVFVGFPIVAWAGLRFGMRGATLVTFGMALLATSVLTRAQLGPTMSQLQAVKFLLALHLAYALTGLLLAAGSRERERLLRQEAEMEDAYRALIAASPFAVIGVDHAGRVLVWSSAAERLFGWRKDAMLGAPLDARLAPGGPPLLGAGRQGGVAFEAVARHQDGRLLDVAITTWPLPETGGEAPGHMAVVEDITERRRAARLEQATYRISEAALRATDLDQLYRAIHGIVSELMPAPNFCIALRDPGSGLLTFPYWADTHEPAPAPRTARLGYTEHVLRTAQPVRDRPTAPDSLLARGEVEPIGPPAEAWMGVPLLVAGQVIGVLAVQSYEPGAAYGAREQSVLEFVSDQVAMAIARKRAEAALRESEERFRLLAAASNDIVYEWEATGDRSWWSDNLRDLLGYEPSELPGTGPAAWAILAHEEDRARVAAGYRAALGGPDATWRDEYRARRRDGGEVWILDRAHFLRDPSGRVRRVIGAMLDITPLREAHEALARSEAQLRQAAKMEAVGRLAGGVAHDFNNLLTSVIGHTDLALARPTLPPEVRDDLLEVKAAGARAAELTRQLLAFSRKQVLEVRVVDLNAVIQGVARLLRRTIGEDVELVLRLAPGLGRVRADPVQLEQVFINLAVNARDAMPEGGRLTIETLNATLEGRPGVEVRVTDTGHGMSAEVRAHLFEPFFTTKDVGKGTGLGLATSYGIVKQSGGEITVRTAPGAGATFTIHLPQAAGEPGRAEGVALMVDGPGSETVLLVEDDDSVRTLTHRVLVQQGYRVLAAPTGEAALELSRKFPDPIHLLLTDVVMPGMSGTRLAEVLETERPGLRCLYMSGYAAGRLGERAVRIPEHAYLQKPFTASQLFRRVRQVLDADLMPQG